MVVTGTAGGTPGSGRKKPVLAVRGKRRKAIQKLLHYCKVVRSQDIKEQLRAESLNYSPFLFTVRQGNPTEKALGVITARCQSVLSAKVS